MIHLVPMSKPEPEAERRVPEPSLIFPDVMHGQPVVVRRYPPLASARRIDDLEAYWARVRFHQWQFRRRLATAATRLADARESEVDRMLNVILDSEGSTPVSGPGSQPDTGGTE